MASTVSNGLYATFDASEIAEEWTKYKTAVKARTTSGGKEILSASVGGKSYTYGFPEGVASLEEWRYALEDAQRQLDDEDQVPTHRTALRFN